MINHIQNKSFVHIIHVCVRCIFNIYIHTHMQYIFVKYLHVYILGLGDIVKNSYLGIYWRYTSNITVFSLLFIYIYFFFTYRTMLSNKTMHIKGYENTNNVNLSLYIMCKKYILSNNDTLEQIKYLSTFSITRHYKISCHLSSLI